MSASALARSRCRSYGSRRAGAGGIRTSSPYGRRAALQEASERLFTAFGDLIRRGQQDGVPPPGDPERLHLLLIATLQGIAALVTSGRTQPGQTDALVTDAVTLFTHGQR